MGRKTVKDARLYGSGSQTKLLQGDHADLDEGAEEGSQSLCPSHTTSDDTRRMATWNRPITEGLQNFSRTYGRIDYRNEATPSRLEDLSKHHLKEQSRSQQDGFQEGAKISAESSAGKRQFELGNTSNKPSSKSSDLAYKKDNRLTERLQQYENLLTQVRHDTVDLQYPYGPPGEEYELTEPIIGPPIVTQGEYDRWQMQKQGQ